MNTITDLRFHLKHQLDNHSAAEKFYWAPTIMSEGWIRKTARDFGVDLTKTELHKLHAAMDAHAHDVLMKRVYQEQRRRGANLFTKKPQGYPKDSNSYPKEPDAEHLRSHASLASPLLLTAA